MKLPKIDYNDLPDEVKALVGEDFEFDSLVDDNYAVEFPVSSERYKSDRYESARKMIQFRKYDEMTDDILKRYEDGHITKEQAEDLWSKANKLNPLT
tara:strand:- start:427 stop:717 length:291 start_codon:yes stop_codon:yes gene_type:complete